MEKTREAHRIAEQAGLSYREAEWVVESDLFLDEYPQWDLGSPHQSVILHEMFLHTESRGWKEAERMCHWGCKSQVREPSTEDNQSALHIIGYHTSRKELRDVYHSVYLLNRALGSPSCGEVKWKRAIQEILSLLQERLRRRTSSANAKDAPKNKMGSASSPTYEVALWEVHRKVMETTASLQNDLDRLDNEMRGRPRACSQSRTWHRMQSRSRHRRQSRGQSRTRSESRHRAQAGCPHWEHSWGGSGDWAGARSWDYHQVGSQDEWTHLRDCSQGPQHRRVSFRIPEGEDSAMENWEPSVELPIKDLELWLDQQADQLGTPAWWEELKAIPGIMDLHKFAWKICTSFCVPEIWSQASPDQSYSAPPAPKCLNWGAFLPERLEYQDVQWRPKLLTEAYCQCLQYWVEKVYPPISLEVCPLAESVRELCRAMGEFLTITTQDILEGLKMDRPTDSCWPPLWPYSTGCWIPQLRGKRKILLPLEFPSRLGCPGHGAEPPYLFQLSHLPACQELRPYQHFCPPAYQW